MPPLFSGSKNRPSKKQLEADRKEAEREDGVLRRNVYWCLIIYVSEDRIVQILNDYDFRFFDVTSRFKYLSAPANVLLRP
jgi:hypothetical protein